MLTFQRSACQLVALKRAHSYNRCTENSHFLGGNKMPKVDLTDRVIATVKVADKAENFFDSRTTGLNLRVAPTGVKTWSIMFDSPRDGKRARLNIGHYPATSLAAARSRAIEACSH